MGTQVVKEDHVITEYKLIETNPVVKEVVIEGEPKITTIRRVIEGDPSVTTVTRIIGSKFSYLLSFLLFFLIIAYHDKLVFRSIYIYIYGI